MKICCQQEEDCDRRGDEPELEAVEHLLHWHGLAAHRNLHARRRGASLSKRLRYLVCHAAKVLAGDIGLQSSLYGARSMKRGEQKGPGIPGPSVIDQRGARTD